MDAPAFLNRNPLPSPRTKSKPALMGPVTASDNIAGMDATPLIPARAVRPTCRSSSRPIDGLGLSAAASAREGAFVSGWASG